MSYQFHMLAFIWYRYLDIYEPSNKECKQAKERLAAFKYTVVDYRC